jgi:hypothetical protein
MNETNLLSLIRPWLNNICQIITKKLQYRFEKILHLNAGVDVDAIKSEHGIHA